MNLSINKEPETTVNVPQKSKRGRKRKNSGKETQHILYMDQELWDAADDLPESRQDIAREAFLNKIAYYQSDLPKLKWQLEDVRNQIQSLLSKEMVIAKRIEQLEAKAVIEVTEFQKVENKKEEAIKNTIQMCNTIKKGMGYGHYAKLSELSGIEMAKIEVFLKDAKFRPTEEAVRLFYGR